VVRLAEAVARAGRWNTPIRLNETTRAYFQRLAKISPPAEAARFLAILDPARAAETDRYFRLHDPGHYSILRTSVVPTVVKAGFRSNVIPSEAEAYLDVRALPDENIPAFVNELKRVINTPGVQVVAPTDGRPAAPPSRLDTEMYRAFETVSKRMFDAPVLPGMLTGATDNAQLRAKGVQAYGVGPMVQPSAGPLGGAHADNENIRVAALMKMIEFLWQAVIAVAAE
jgi:acetylornithine deacetylase/succinyl-diaminopimelate desuccinylase-like protein